MKRFAGAFALALTAGSAQAATQTFLVGDRDCFGLGGTCAVGDLWHWELGGVYFNDYSTAADPAGTDDWTTGSRAYSVSFSGALNTATQAVLRIFIAGTDLGDGVDVSINGTKVGSMLTAGGINDLVEFHEFGGVLDALSDTTTIALTNTLETDGYIVDHLEVVLSDEAIPVMPLPSSVPLMATGLAAFGLLGMRRWKTG